MMRLSTAATRTSARALSTATRSARRWQVPAGESVKLEWTADSASAAPLDEGLQVKFPSQSARLHALSLELL
jgi:hypothetical protein